MSIARITSLGALATLASCNVYHPALQPSPYPESASVNRNGTDYLVAELENPTPAYVAPTPPPSVALPSLPQETTPATPVVAEVQQVTPQPALAEPPSAADVAVPEPKIVSATKPAPPQPVTAPEPTVEPEAETERALADAPSLPEPELAAGAEEEPPVVASVQPDAPADPQADASRAEEFAVEFAKTLPFPSDAEISAFPKVLSPETLTSPPKSETANNSTFLLEKVRKNLARAKSATRVPSPSAIQPAAPATRIPSAKPADSDAPLKFDPAIESLSILPADPHDERLDFGLDLGPTSTFDFEAGSN